MTTSRPVRGATFAVGILVWFCLAGCGWAAAAAAAVPAARPQTAAEVIPPPVPDAQNAAPLYLEALAVLEAEDVWNGNLMGLADDVGAALGGPGQANLVGLLEHWRIPEEANRQPTLGEACDEFGRRLESPAVATAMTLIARAAARPACRYNVDYSMGAETLLPHLAKQRRLARFLAAVAAMAAERGDRETAWEGVLWQLSLGDHLRSEPLLISQLVRTAVLHIGIGTAQRTLAQAPPSVETVAVLDQRLAGCDDTAPWVLAIDGERLILGEWMLNQPQAKIEAMLQSGNATAAPAWTAAQVAASLPLHRQALLRLAELAARPYHQVRSEIEAFPGADANANPVAKTLLSAVGSVCRKTAECQAAIRVTRLGLRLKRHQAAHGTYPASLADLDLADIAPEKRQDPFTGNALCYRRDGDGAVLYSVGPDGKDDGGQPRAGGPQATYDVVWRLGN